MQNRGIARWYSYCTVLVLADFQVVAKILKESGADAPLTTMRLIRVKENGLNLTAAAPHRFSHVPVHRVSDSLATPGRPNIASLKDIRHLYCFDPINDTGQPGGLKFASETVCTERHHSAVLRVSGGPPTLFQACDGSCVPVLVSKLAIENSTNRGVVSPKSLTAGLRKRISQNACYLSR